MATIITGRPITTLVITTLAITTLVITTVSHRWLPIHGRCSPHGV